MKINKKNCSGSVDYNVYTFSVGELLLYTLVCMAVVFAISFIFYRSIIFSFVISFAGIFFVRFIRKYKIEKRKKNLLLQFKDMLYSISSSLSAGNSVESAFENCQNDLKYLYPDNNPDIIREIAVINNKSHMNVPIEETLSDFANRSHLEDVKNFADVFEVCKRTSGNVREVIKTTTTIISEKIEVKQEIDTMLAEKKLESKLVVAMPIGVIFLLEMTTLDYMYPLFSTFAGRIAMTIALAFIVIAYFGAKKLMKIEV